MHVEYFPNQGTIPLRPLQFTWWLPVPDSPWTALWMPPSDMSGRRRFLRLIANNANDFVIRWVSVLDRGPFGQIRRNLKALGRPKYSAQGLEDLLSQYIDDDRFLDSMLTSVIIPSFDIKHQQPVFFSSAKVHFPSTSPYFLLMKQRAINRLCLKCEKLPLYG